MGKRTHTEHSDKRLLSLGVHLCSGSYCRVYENQIEEPACTAKPLSNQIPKLRLLFFFFFPIETDLLLSSQLFQKQELNTQHRISLLERTTLSCTVLGAQPALTAHLPLRHRKHVGVKRQSLPMLPAQVMAFKPPRKITEHWLQASEQTLCLTPTCSPWSEQHDEHNATSML